MWSVTGNTTLINAFTNVVIFGTKIDLYSEVSGGNTPIISINATATAEWEGNLSENTPQPKITLPEGAFLNRPIQMYPENFKVDQYLSDAGDILNVAAAASADLFDTPANEVLNGVLSLRAVGGGATTSAMWLLSTIGGVTSVASIAPDKTTSAAGGHAFTLAEVQNGGGAGLNRFTITNDNGSQSTTYNFSFSNYTRVPTYLW